jgi:hypothetical protein
MEEVINIYLQNPIWQTFWLIWMIWAIIAFTQKNDKNVIKILAIANVFWVIHFLLMWLYTWVVMVLVAIIRLYLSLKFNKNFKIFIYISLITLIVWILTFKDYSSIFPILASLLATYAFFYLERIRLRLALLLCSSFWLSYNYIHFSIWWIATESILHVVHLITIYRIIFYKQNIISYLKSKIKIDYDRYLTIVDFIRIRFKAKKK